MGVLYGKDAIMQFDLNIAVSTTFNLTWCSPSAFWNWCCMGIESWALNRFLVWFPIDGGNSGCAFELEVAVCKMRVLHLFWGGEKKRRKKWAELRWPGEGEKKSHWNSNEIGRYRGMVITSKLSLVEKWGSLLSLFVHNLKVKSQWRLMEKSKGTHSSSLLRKQKKINYLLKF